MTGHCVNCEHWHSDEGEWQAEKIGFRRCERIRPRWKIDDTIPKEVRAGAWGNDAEEERWHAARRDVFSREAAYVQDGSEYRAELFTAPNFGCVLHELAKEKT